MVQAVPALSNPLLNPGFEEYEPVSGRGIPELANFIGWTEGEWLKTEQARIRLDIGNQDAVVGESIPDFPISWNVSGDGFWSDRVSVSRTIDLQREFYSNASMNITINLQPDGDRLNNATFNQLFVDNTYAGAAGNEGNPSGVPEPDTMILLGSGLLALAGIGRRFTRT
jgi:hypothetical protein